MFRIWIRWGCKKLF